MQVTKAGGRLSDNRWFIPLDNTADNAIQSVTSEQRQKVKRERLMKNIGLDLSDGPPVKHWVKWLKEKTESVFEKIGESKVRR